MNWVHKRKQKWSHAELRFPSLPSFCQISILIPTSETPKPLFKTISYLAEFSIFLLSPLSSKYPKQNLLQKKMLKYQHFLSSSASWLLMVSDFFTWNKPYKRFKHITWMTFDFSHFSPDKNVNFWIILLLRKLSSSKSKNA